MLGLGKKVSALFKGVKMLDSGVSEQEARSFMESQGLSNINITKSKPTVVDVSSEGMKKKLTRGIGVTYSGVRTSSRGLLSDVKLEKKTLLGA